MKSTRLSKGGDAAPALLLWRAWGPAAVLAILAVVVYLPALQAGFIWDDRLLLTGNDLVHAANGWFRMWFGTESPDYFPITYGSFWLEWRIWGKSAVGYHAVNVLLHAVNAILLWRVLLRLRVPGAWLVALLFAVHPVNAASVGWISERKNTLSLAFYLASALAYFRSERENRNFEYAAALVLFVLALLSKTSVVMLPPVLLLCAWWQRGRISWVDLRRAAPFFALSLAAGLGTIWFQNHNVINEADIPLGNWWVRLVRAGWAVWFYLFQLSVPWNLSMVYPRWEVNPASPEWIFPSLLLVVVFLGAWIFRKGWGRPVLFALGYFVLSLFPVLGFFKMYYFRLSPVADQWLYLPGIGILALLGSAGHTLLRKMPLAERSVAVVVIGIFSVLTWQRATTLQSPESLWSDVLRKDPASWTAASNLALADLAEGRNQDALRYARMAAKLQPDFIESWFNLGAILDANGLSGESVSVYRSALKMKPDYAPAHNELGLALERAGDGDEATREYQEAVKLQPENFQFELNFGSLLYNENRYDEAIVQFRKALALQPNSADGHNDLGAALHALGRLPEAVVEYRAALRLNPMHSDARENLEEILATDPAAGR